MIPMLAQVGSLNSPFATDVEDYAAGKCQHLEIWLTKLDEFLKQTDVKTTRRLLDQHEVSASVASIQGGLLDSQGQRRKLAWDLLRERVAYCLPLGISTIVVAADVAAPIAQADVDRVQASLVELARLGEEERIRFAIEFQARSAFGNNLETAAALVGQVESEALGICLDAFHFHIGPSKLRDLRYLTADNLFHVQLSDVADVPREIATDSDRILPGEGDIDLPPLIEHMKSIGYQRAVSLELMNPQIWQVPARQFGEIGMTSIRKVLGLAES